MVIEELLSLTQVESASWLCKREPSNYDLLLELYKKTNYYPKEMPLDQWASKSKASWSIQDKLVPGSCSMGFFHQEAVSSFASLPISQSVVYGHSMCMIRTLPAALTLIPQAARVTRSVNCWENIQYFAGAYSRNSSFTSKLFSDSSHVGPNDQLVIPSYGFFLNNMSHVNVDVHYELISIAIDELDLSYLSVAMQRVITLLSKPHASLASIHKITAYVIKNKLTQKPQAIILAHDSPELFTALDLLNYCWVFVFNAEYAMAVCHFLSLQPLFKKRHIELITGDENCTISMPDEVQVDPRCWIFTPKDEAHYILEYFMQAILHVISKYPEEQVLNMVRTLITSDDCNHK